MLTKLNILCRIHCQENTTTLTGGFRFNYENWTFLRVGDWVLTKLLSEGPKFITFAREEPSPRVKVVLIGQPFLHVIQGFSKLIFPSKDKHSRKMIHSLIWSES